MKIILTLITILFVTTLVLSGTGTVRTLTSAEKQRIVDNLNTFRNSVLVSPRPRAGSMSTITWDNTLENLSRNYAEQCIWGHSPTTVNNGARPSSVGENLYMYATSQTLSTQFLIDEGHTSWQNERLFYTLSNNSCATDKVCGHYTVIVKDVNNRVGCAIADCSVLDNYARSAEFPVKSYLVCNYNGQNIVGVPPYTAETTTTTVPPPTTIVSTTPPSPTNVNTTAVPSPSTPSPGILQPFAIGAFDRVNKFRVETLNRTAFLHSQAATSYLRDFTIRQAAALNFLPNDLVSGLGGRDFGEVGLCYRSCWISSTTCNDVDTANFLIINRTSHLNSTRYNYFSTAYADNRFFRFWTMLWTSKPGIIPSTVLESDDTLQEESDD